MALRRSKALFFILWAVALSGCLAPAPKIKVALTFDDLPLVPKEAGTFDVVEESRKASDRTLKALKRHRAPAAGFVIGNKLTGDDYEYKPEERQAAAGILAAWKHAGVRLGSHTQTHQALSKIGLDAYIRDNEEFLRKMAPFLGEPSKARPQYFRFPFLDEGGAPDEVDGFKRWLDRRHYVAAPVSISLHDWAFESPFFRCEAQGRDKDVRKLRSLFVESAAKRLKQAAALSKQELGRSIPQILLLHQTSFTSRMLEEVLRAYEKAGVEFVTLEAALQDPAYSQPLPAIRHPHPSPFYAAVVGNTVLQQHAGAYLKWLESSGREPGEEDRRLERLVQADSRQLKAVRARVDVLCAESRAPKP